MRVSKKVPCLFDFSRDGQVLFTNTFTTRTALVYIKEQQNNRWIYPDWKLDIFISNECDCQPIFIESLSSGSWAYDVGGRFQVLVKKRTNTVPIGYFPTYEMAINSINFIKEYLLYRYSIKVF